MGCRWWGAAVAVEPFSHVRFLTLGSASVGAVQSHLPCSQEENRRLCSVLSAGAGGLAGIGAGDWAVLLGRMCKPPNSSLGSKL